MSELMYTDHAQTRTGQRGMSYADVELITRHGIEVERGFMLTEKAGRAYIDTLKQQIRQMERLIGTRVVCDGTIVITAYRPGRRKSQSLLRRSLRRDRR
ncbi:hypothetical protein ACOSOMT5_P1168 [Acidiphilium sp. MT5]